MSGTARKPYSIVNDPLYFGVVIFFAALATGLPAALGSRWFLLIAQTIALFILTFVAWRNGTALRAAAVLLTWVIVQAVSFFVITLIFEGAETAISDGFEYRSALLAWIYGAGALPASWGDSLAGRLIQLVGVTVGSTISGGLIGIGFLVRSVNLYAFGAATAWVTSGSVWGLLAALEPWWLLRILAYIGLIATCALPGYTGKWNPGQWQPAERWLLINSFILLAVALTLELILPGIWARWLSALIA
jgi:hypothetical protein